MTRMAYDAEDLLGLVLFITGSLGTLGFVSFSVFGIGLGDTIFQFAADGYTTQFTLGIVLSLAGLGVILFTNDLDWRAWSMFQIWLVAAVVWMVLSPPFVPVMKSLMLGSDLGGMAAFIIETVGVGFLSWSG